jgi:ABC-type branched-subunit amino acid transport system ATPase component
MSAVLDIVDLTRKFGGITALDGVSTKVREGSIHAVIGPNGSGKTTLFNVISGTYRPRNCTSPELGR